MQIERRAVPRWLAVVATAAGVTVAATVGGLMMYAAWDHNPQGVFHDDAGHVVDWPHWLLIGAGWGLPAGVAVGVALYAFLRAMAEPPRP